MRRTNTDIFRHLEELTIKNEALLLENKKIKGENRDNRAENARLRNRIIDPEETLEERIQKAVEEAVAKAVEPLQTAIAEKDKEIMRLKAQLNRDSSNSSKPSGS